MPKKAEGRAQRVHGCVYDNHGYWWLDVRLPGEAKHRKRPLCAPGSAQAMRSDRPKEMAIAAAHRIWEEATRAARDAPTASRTVDDVCDAYLRHAREYYKDGGEFPNHVIALRFLREIYGRHAMGELVHTDILRVRDALVRHGYARTTVNRYVRIICGQMVPWAFDEGLVLASTREELAAPVPLKRGRSAAKESVPVRPVDDATIAATIAHMMPNTADMVRVHRLTGMRPEELCAMTWELIDTFAEPWIYRPARHKNDWRGEWGQPRAVLIGPKARAILERHRETSHPFSPVAAVAELMAAKRAARTSPFYPCRDENYSRADPHAVRVPREAWDTQSYTNTIQAACRRAGVQPWGANRLRHAFATEVRRRFGLEACRAVLGHSMGARVTDRYSFDAIEEEIIRKAAPAVEALG